MHSYQLRGMANLVVRVRFTLVPLDKVTRGLWERDCGMASTLHMRKTITLMSPNKGKTAVHGCH